MGRKGIFWTYNVKEFQAALPVVPTLNLKEMSFIW